MIQEQRNNQPQTHEPGGISPDQGNDFAQARHSLRSFSIIASLLSCPETSEPEHSIPVHPGYQYIRGGHPIEADYLSMSGTDSGRTYRRLLPFLLFLALSGTIPARLRACPAFPRHLTLLSALCSNVRTGISTPPQSPRAATSPIRITRLDLDYRSLRQSATQVVNASVRAWVSRACSAIAAQAERTRIYDARSGLSEAAIIKVERVILIWTWCSSWGIAEALEIPVRTLLQRAERR